MVEYNVIANFKIYLEDGNKMPEVKQAIEQMAKVNHFKEEDVGFGIKILRAFVMFNDDQGGMDELEEKIKKIPGVSETQLDDVSRV